MMYIKGLEFEEKPNYEMLRLKFKNCMNRVNTNKKEEFLADWQILRKNKREEKKQTKMAQEEKAVEETSKGVAPTNLMASNLSKDKVGPCNIENYIIKTDFVGGKCSFAKVEHKKRKGGPGGLSG